MYVIQARNVNYALKEGLEWLKASGLKKNSRNGSVIRSPVPVTTVYENPCERVLWLPLRDANPVFHLLESLWMLAGRNDVKFPATFAGQIAVYSDDGVTLNGAYGYRWRKHFGYDQLPVIIDELRKNPDSRRCVLQMWDASDISGNSDIYKATNGSADVPCNTAAYFEVLDGKLNMTVTNRSNDAIWGVTGANSVHFSVLQEYMAVSIGVNIGRYYQISNNYHVYTGRPDVDRLFDGKNVMVPPAIETDWYSNGIQAVPLIKSLEVFDFELQEFFGKWDSGFFNSDENCQRILATKEFTEPAFYDLAIPMVYAHRKFKEGDLERAYDISKAFISQNQDWSMACQQWFSRRILNRKNKG